MTRRRCRVICFSWFGVQDKIYSRQKSWICLIATETANDVMLMCGGQVKNNRSIFDSTEVIAEYFYRDNR